ncbi:thiamine pyrophosphate-binding protein [Shewanella oneidensis MR-1]|uniref:TPP-dependent enzyme involved in flagella modificaiton n=1 Tax=Shewanella oneidensis (strain ATCC 700550 / JCM 31522 / CIP 106686 / LMG 19005 / NCIMB 14063 / MR-1) TaxID=211586 RepID=Q8EC82_SHEON|nr:thiamine pyrophosphate-binding protein [Shewanella oneidensis]AAN56260.1 TPP-dependent enzyme involved in flagella modificaiton [Shewanella oneidensis MR-1]MDX5999309.1 thiamine pyrophosphate-binding protein [Shewanella oneidensis]MEE2026357.1 Acetolactate synthase isozyme 2 large subunit [Shewanella oneidensis]QKG97683.1 thiamine pyrophosphate-binding protein [Shewanella oneidensis MR-1]
MSTSPITVVADAIIEFLAHQGIKAFHNYPGGTIAPLLDACKRFGVTVYTSRNEQGAGYAALAQGKLTQLPGIVAVTSGPGVTNVLTPVADAYFDGIPMLVFTGQVGTGDLTGQKRVRQSGFQEVDTPSLMKPITKGQFQPKNSEELYAILPIAWQLALEGRKGPVSIDLPMDVQRSAAIKSIKVPEIVTYPVNRTELGTFIDELINAIDHSQKPVIICGNGMTSPALVDAIRTLRNYWPAPVSHSLLGVGVLDTDDSGSLGFHGHTGSQLAGKAIAECDLLLVLGSRLDVRQTGTLKTAFASNAKIFRVDLDIGELTDSRIAHHKAVQAELEQFFDALHPKFAQLSPPNLSSWHNTISQWKAQLAWPYPDYPGIAPKLLLEKLSNSLPENTIVTTGVGAHQHWVARHFRFALPHRQLFTSAGHGTMGYDLPTAIGAAIHSPESTILCIAGDGSFQMNIQELGVIKELGLKIKILVLDNHRLGLVSQFQLMNWETDTACGNKQSPNFALIAQGYGIKALHCSDSAKLEQTLAEFIETDESILLHIEIATQHDVLPMLLGGQTTDKMWPYFDMQGNPRDPSNV